MTSFESSCELEPSDIFLLDQTGNATVLCIDNSTIAQDNYVTWQSRKTRVSIFSAETRQQKRPLWKGDDTLCADGRSCEFFLMCWMTAGLLDGSCGGIMYACCQRKDPKALTDYNLIESPRDQSRPLPLDLYPETASDDRKSFLRKACRPYFSTALESMRSILVPSIYSFFVFFFCSPSRSLSIDFLFINYFTHICVYSKHVLPLLLHTVYLEHSFLTGNAFHLLFWILSSFQ